MFIKPSTNIMKHIYMIQALGHGQYDQKKCSCIESQKTFTTSTAGGAGGGGKLFAWMFSMLLFTLNCENYDPWSGIQAFLYGNYGYIVKINEILYFELSRSWGKY